MTIDIFSFFSGFQQRIPTKLFHQYSSVSKSYSHNFIHSIEFSCGLFNLNKQTESDYSFMTKIITLCFAVHKAEICIINPTAVKK